MQFESNIKTKVLIIFLAIRYMQKIDQNVPQLDDFQECSSGSEDPSFPQVCGVHALPSSRANLVAVINGVILSLSF